MIKKPLLKTLGYCSLASTLLWSASTLARESLDKVIAIVDEDVVLASDFQQRWASAQQQNAQSSRAVPEQLLREQLINQMIVESVQLQMARRAGIRISDTELNTAISNIAQRNGLSLEQFRDGLIAEGQSYIEFREQIRREMLIQTVQRSQVGRLARVTDREIDNYLASEEGRQATAEEYLIHHTLIPVSGRAEEAQAKSYADKLYSDIQQGADFKTVATADNSYRSESSQWDWRKLQDLPSLLTSIAPAMERGKTMAPIRSPAGFHLVTLVDKQGGEELIEQTRVRHILLKPSAIRDREATRKEMEDIRQRIIDGEGFDALAREYSEDIGSAQEGGDLGWALPGQMVPAFEAMMGSSEIDKLSPVFESRFGWHILLVEERRMKDMSERIRRNKARELLSDRKFKEERTAWLQKIRDEAFVEIKQ